MSRFDLYLMLFGWMESIGSITDTIRAAPPGCGVMNRMVLETVGPFNFLIAAGHSIISKTFV
jgi:hypothetical protein